MAVVDLMAAQQSVCTSSDTALRDEMVARVDRPAPVGPLAVRVRDTFDGLDDLTSADVDTALAGRTLNERWSRVKAELDKLATCRDMAAGTYVAPAAVTVTSAGLTLTDCSDVTLSDASAGRLTCNLDEGDQVEIAISGYAVDTNEKVPFLLTAGKGALERRVNDRSTSSKAVTSTSEVFTIRAWSVDDNIIGSRKASWGSGDDYLRYETNGRTPKVNIDIIFAEDDISIMRVRHTTTAGAGTPVKEFRGHDCVLPGSSTTTLGERSSLWRVNQSGINHNDRIGVAARSFVEHPGLLPADVVVTPGEPCHFHAAGGRPISLTIPGAGTGTVQIGRRTPYDGQAPASRPLTAHPWPQYPTATPTTHNRWYNGVWRALCVSSDNRDLLPLSSASCKTSTVTRTVPHRVEVRFTKRYVGFWNNCFVAEDVGGQAPGTIGNYANGVGCPSAGSRTPNKMWPGKQYWREGGGDWLDIGPCSSGPWTFTVKDKPPAARGTPPLSAKHFRMQGGGKDVANGLVYSCPGG